MNNNFEVISLAVVSDGTNLRAFADVLVYRKFTLCGCRVIQQAGQTPYVALPQREYTGADGKKRFRAIVEFHEPGWEDALQAAVLESYHDHPEGIKQHTAFGQEVRNRAGIGGRQ